MPDRIAPLLPPHTSLGQEARKAFHLSQRPRLKCRDISNDRLGQERIVSDAITGMFQLLLGFDEEVMGHVQAPLGIFTLS